MKRFWLSIGILVLSAPVVEGASCTGDANCRACSDCLKCKHCSGGGTCGVCVASKRAKSSMPRPTSAKTKPDCCSSVVDGETIEVTRADGKLVKVRLIGVRTPETPKTVDTSPSKAADEITKKVATQEKSLPGETKAKNGTLDKVPQKNAAWDFNQEVIGFAKSFILKQDVVLERDLSNLRNPDGTILAYVYRMSDRKMLNEAMISSGFGIIRPEPKFSLLGQFSTAELGARTRLLGSWGWPGRIKAENEKRAHTWLKMGDNLKENNVKAARQYYADILATYPDTESAAIAREKLKSLPE
jgi:endonuclease YncB( thermonuclease family)